MINLFCYKFKNVLWRSGKKYNLDILNINKYKIHVLWILQQKSVDVCFSRYAINRVIYLYIL